MSVSEVDRRRVFNDDRWRQFNESGEFIAFICECFDPDCFATIVLSGAQFEAARARPPHQLLQPGHPGGSDESLAATKSQQA
jgi:hypothetical protein